MQAFIQHVSSPGNVDIPFTITRRRSLREMLRDLPTNAPERPYFERDKQLIAAFPDGTFNCWGLPSGARPRLFETQVGDLVLFLPSVGANGSLLAFGIVKAKCETECWEASKILWPRTLPNDRLWPYLFFFDTNSGYRLWSDFARDLGYQETWNPHGWYRKVPLVHFAKWGGPEGYIEFLKTRCGFH